MALNNLSNNKNITIQKSDKGNSVVLLDEDKYLERMWKILNNNAKLELLQFDRDKELNFVLNLGKKIINVLKLQRLITSILCYCSSFPGILYGLAKVHKPVTDQHPSLQPILLKISQISCFVINAFNIKPLYYKGFIFISGRNVFF